MSTSRLAPLPLHHVVAEVAAFPLASEEALGLAVTELRPDLKAQTGKLWRAAEMALVHCFPSFSVDELVGFRDHVWFSRHCGVSVSLVSYLGDLPGIIQLIRVHRHQEDLT